MSGSSLAQYPKQQHVDFKQYTSPFNPFNSWKFMFHADRVWKILSWLKGDSKELPPPVYVTIDPTDVCNHACFFCISKDIQESDNTSLKKDLLVSLATVLHQFTFSSSGKSYGVNAIVLAGGGEPLANVHTEELINKLAFYRANGGAEFSIISNGELLNESVSKILVEHATWAGFSVDAGNSVSHKAMHVPKKKNSDVFETVIDNIRRLSQMRNASSRKPRLNIGYKFLIHPKNYESIVEGTVLAKNIGCDEIQFRPVYVDDAEQVMPAIVEQAQNSIMEARRMCEDRSFTVHGVMHKFGANWLPTHDFGSCTMTPLGLIFSADGNMYLCCDRRGDPKLKLGLWHDGKTARLDYIQNLWGSDKHRWLINQIKTSECPRCSFYFYNKAATEAFKEDYMNRNFL